MHKNSHIPLHFTATSIITINNFLHSHNQNQNTHHEAVPRPLRPVLFRNLRPRNPPITRHHHAIAVTVLLLLLLLLLLRGLGLRRRLHRLRSHHSLPAEVSSVPATGAGTAAPHFRSHKRRHCRNRQTATVTVIPAVDQSSQNHITECRVLHRFERRIAFLLPETSSNLS